VSAKKKITYVISLVSHSLLFERTLALLNRDKYELTVVLLHSHKTEFESNIADFGISVYRIDYKSKKDIPTATARMGKLFRKIKPDIVHTHLFEGSLIGSVAARVAGIKRRVHTRHDATIHHDYFPSAVKYDKLINRLSTDIISITENVKNILTEKENAPAEKITVIHHGFRIEDFSELSSDESSEIKQKYSSIKGSPVIGVVSRFIEWKGIQYTIDAFVDVLKKYPSAHLVLANAQGPYDKQIRTKLESIPADRYTIIHFEKSAAALFSLFDIFVHVPVDDKSEAFGQVYIEAMAAGIPSIITRSGIACDYAADRENCLVVPYRNAPAISKAILELAENKTLSAKLRDNARKLAADEFTLERMITQLEKLYDK